MQTAMLLKLQRANGLPIATTAIFETATPLDASYTRPGKYETGVVTVSLTLSFGGLFGKK